MQRNAPIIKRTLAGLVTLGGTCFLASGCLPPPRAAGPVTAIGDSLMQGYRLDNVTRFTHKGDSADAILARLRSDDNERTHIASSSVVAVSAGTNTGRRAYGDVMSDIINDIYAIKPDIRIVLVPLYGTAPQVNTEAYNTILHDLASAHRHYGREVYVADWLMPNFRPAHCLTSDGVHPTPSCYGTLGDRLSLTLRPPQQGTTTVK